MRVFEIEGHDLRQIGEKPPSTEKFIQDLTNKNLDKIFGVQFIKSEFPIDDRRIDGLAFDDSTMSFVIIEYKKQRNSGLMDQVMIYRNLLKNNKEAFLYVYDEVTNKKLKIDQVNWTSIRIILISTEFTPNQIEATKSDNLIDLYKVHLYENNTISYHLINQNKKKTKSSSNGNKPKNDTPRSTWLDRINNADPKVRQLIEQLSTSIEQKFGAISQPYNRTYRFDIPPKSSKHLFAMIICKKNIATIAIRTAPDFSPDDGKIRYVKGWFFGTPHEARMSITHENMDLIMRLLEDSVKLVSSNL